MTNLIETLQNSGTPENAYPFEKVDSKDFAPSVDFAIEQSRKSIQQIEKLSSVNFQNTIEALEVSGSLLDKITTLFYNLLHACSDEHMQEIAGPISEKLADYSNDIQLSQNLFEKIKQVYNQKESENLSDEQSKLLEETYKGFTRNGALLDESKKEKLRNIDRELASLGPAFGNNLLKATNSFELNLTNEADTKGLPASALATAKEEAQKRKQEGWTFTLQGPSYLAFMKYLESRELREKMWKAYNQKALNGENSNRKLCEKIATLRNQRAQLLGYKTHAEFVLEKRMAKKPTTVFEFIEELKAPSIQAAKKEIKDLQQFVKSEYKLDIELQSWDFTFYSEKYKKHLFDISDEELRPYFPIDAVKKGVFLHGEKLYGLQFTKQNDIPVYNKDVEIYRVEKQSQFIGLLYVDLFPRDNKRAGAWMTNYQEQGFDGEKVLRPHVSIVCNFSKPSAETPSLLTFNEVQTLFHEFGHALHSLLSDCHYSSLSGTNVQWDFVELPSQIMENWTYEKESLDLFAKHHETGESIPEAMIQKLKDSSNFQAGYSSTRQLSFCLMDMAWHHDIEGRDLDPVTVEEQSLSELRLLPKVEDTNFSVSFSHIFAGGYSAGYYSYKWAEVLDADAFECFKENGIFDSKTSEKFYSEILSRGGTSEPDVLYRNFRGKNADPKALLRRSGLI